MMIVAKVSQWLWYQESGHVSVLWGRSLSRVTPNPSICAGAVQSRDGFLSLLRHVQLFLALHRGPVPLHSSGWDVLSRETLLLLVHHRRMGWVSVPDVCLLIWRFLICFSSLWFINNWWRCRNSHHLRDCLGGPEAPFPWHWVLHLIC